MIVLTVTDASWAGEEDIVKGRIEPLRSRRAQFNGLAGPGFIEGSSDLVHPICTSSKVTKRVLQAETLT
eukprot:6763821-Pyramimonas_sp.AAC.1